MYSSEFGASESFGHAGGGATNEKRGCPLSSLFPLKRKTCSRSQVNVSPLNGPGGGFFVCLGVGVCVGVPKAEGSHTQSVCVWW
jgi:hypothetical protein